MPDYAPAFIQNPLLGYLIAAIVGSALVVGIAWGIGWLLSRGTDDGGPTPPPAPAA